MQQIFYLTLDPERALGIEDLLTSYHILYSENSQMAIPISNTGINIKNFPKSHDEKVNSTGKMLENNSVIEYIKINSHGKPNILVFKSDEIIEKLCKENNFKLLNPSYKLGNELENKLNFSKFIDEIGVFDQPEYEIFEKLSELNYETLAKKYGTEFVLQFIFGHTGSGTFFISSPDDLEKLKLKFPLRKGKITKKIDGATYTINACITKLGVVIGGLSEQITGDEQLTSSKGGTIGNDFTQRHLNEMLRSEIISKTITFGEELAKKGHKGIFGLDFIIEHKTQKLFIIEANIRQVASCTFASYLQRMHQIMPIMLWHVLELLDFNYEERFLCLNEDDEEWINDQITKFRLSNDKLSYNIKNNQPMHASQVIFRNIKETSVQILDQFPSGVYRMRGRMPEESALLENEEEKYLAVFRLREDGWSTLCLETRGYNIHEAALNEGFIINCQPEKAIIEPHGEIGRIQSLQGAFSSLEDTSVNGWILDSVRAIYENIRTIKVV